jgi:hypothetical protein
VRGGAGGEILSCSQSFSTCPADQLAEALVSCRGHGGWQEEEGTYLLWKARQVADQQGSGAVAVPRGPGGEEGAAILDFAVHGLKRDLFPDLMDFMGVVGGWAPVKAVPKPGDDAVAARDGFPAVVPSTPRAAGLEGCLSYHVEAGTRSGPCGVVLGRFAPLRLVHDEERGTVFEVVSSSSRHTTVFRWSVCCHVDM